MLVVVKTLVVKNLKLNGVFKFLVQEFNTLIIRSEKWGSADRLENV